MSPFVNVLSVYYVYVGVCLEINFFGVVWLKDVTPEDRVCLIRERALPEHYQAGLHGE